MFVGVLVIRGVIVIWVTDVLMDNASVNKHIVIDGLWDFSVLSPWDISVESLLDCVVDSCWNLSYSNFLLNIVGLSCFSSDSFHWELFVSGNLINIGVLVNWVVCRRQLSGLSVG